MKLLIAIVNNEDASLVISELNKAGFMVTKLATSGGFLRAGNVTMLTGVEDEKVGDALAGVGPVFLGQGAQCLTGQRDGRLVPEVLGLGARQGVEVERAAHHRVDHQPRRHGQLPQPAR